MRLAFTIGRAVLGGFFILAGINKILNYSGTVEFAVSGGVSSMLIPIVILLEIIGGGIIASGRPVKVLPLTAFALAGFTLLTNIFFHQFWTFDGEMARLELSLFFKNLAIMGALLMVAGYNRKDA